MIASVIDLSNNIFLTVARIQQPKPAFLKHFGDNLK